MRYIMSLMSLLIFGAVLGISFILNIDTDDKSSRFVGSDRWIEFAVEPTVCNGRLEASGQLVNGARFGGDNVPFLLYEGRNEKAALRFLKPLGPNQSYPRLDSRDQIAMQRQASPADDQFLLESEVPDWVSEAPGSYTLAIWGFRRPGEPLEILRSTRLETC